MQHSVINNEHAGHPVWQGAFFNLSVLNELDCSSLKATHHFSNAITINGKRDSEARRAARGRGKSYILIIFSRYVYHNRSAATSLVDTIQEINKREI